MDTKLGSYYERATIIEGDRYLSSNLGVYSSTTNRLYAGDNVEIIELKDVIQSDSLSIDRNSKTLRLYKSSYLEINDAIINCEKGEFNGKTGVGWFSGGASMMDNQGILSGDSIIVNRDKNEGMAWGHVMISDSSRTCLLYTSSAADDQHSAVLGGRRILKKTTI